MISKFYFWLFIVTAKGDDGQGPDLQLPDQQYVQ